MERTMTTEDDLNNTAARLAAKRQAKKEGLDWKDLPGNDRKARMQAAKPNEEDLKKAAIIQSKKAGG
jgi:hypothetical protein